MKCPDFSQIVDTLDLGILALDPDCRIQYWNRWMERATGKRAEGVLGRSLGELYPEAASRAFVRNFRSVMEFGIVAVFSPRLHGQLFPIPSGLPESEGPSHMPQRCVLGPLREGGAVTSAYLIVEDVTESWMQERRLGGLAMRDGLTGLYNRRYFDRRLEEECERARRYSHQLGVIMLDIDHFKSVNDSFGHPVGDEVLKLVALSCREALRTTDFLARYGGEEFCAILPETGAAEASYLAERLRTAVERQGFDGGGARRTVTVSAGVAIFKEADVPPLLVERADQALYRAKTGGRNRVEAER